MANDNFVSITGNVTRDPELRFTQAGQAVASFGIACNRRWQDNNNEWQEKVSFFDVTCWGTLAENVAESIEKGTRATVTGRLDQRSWETDEGDKRSKVEIVAEAVSPDLRWATAEVTRNPKGDGQAYREPDSRVAPSSRAGSFRSSGRSAPPLDDEEPF